ncbi:MAG: hypothetical protein AAGD07_05430 [Planctomycetota bacterium]
MEKLTLVFGLILVVLGVLGFVGSGSTSSDAEGIEVSTSSETGGNAEGSERSVTALIPAFVGIVLSICGILALNEERRKHAMHAAAMVGLLGTLAGVGRGAMGLGKFFSGDPSLNQRSFLFVWLMAITCGLFVALCVRSFIAVRKAREAEQAS